MKKLQLDKLMADYGRETYGQLGDAIELVSQLLQCDTEHRREWAVREPDVAAKREHLSAVAVNEAARKRLLELQTEIGVLVSPAHL